jgi:superfamily II DNA or RNA helicase
MSTNIIRLGEYTAVRKHFIPLNTDIVLKEVEKNGKTFCFIKSEDEQQLVTLDYSFPTNPLSGVKPYLHQKITTEFIIHNNRCLIANSQGTGKSLAALHAVDYLISNGAIKNCLYVGPKSILIDPIVREITNHFNHLRYGLAIGSKAAKLKAIEADPEILVINWDGLTSLLESNQMPTFDMIIYDEATALKNPSTRRYKQFWRYVARVCRPEVRLVLMSGTPTAQSPTDAFTLIQLINPHGLVDARITSFSKFQEVVMYKDPWSPFKWTPKENAEKTVYDLLQPSIRFTLEDAVDLPQFTFIYKEVPLSKQQDFLLKALKRDSMALIEQNRLTVDNAVGLRNKLLQILCGAVITDDDVKYLDYSDRYQALLDIIDESENPVVIFINYKASQLDLKRRLENDLKQRIELINGDTSTTERGEICKDFENRKIRVLLAHPKTVSYGVDLTMGNVMIYFSAIDSSELYTQGIDRIRRLSSVKKGYQKFLIYHLYGNELEQKIYEALKSKRLNQDLLFKLLRSEL